MGNACYCKSDISPVYPIAVGVMYNHLLRAHLRTTYSRPNGKLSCVKHRILGYCNDYFGDFREFHEREAAKYRDVRRRTGDTRWMMFTKRYLCARLAVNRDVDGRYYYLVGLGLGLDVYLT